MEKNAGKKVEKNKFDSVKILLLGNSSVGKTSILIKFSENRFEENYVATVGLNYVVKKIQVNQTESIKMQIWDTSGEERFKSIAKNFYRGAQGVFLVYDITDKQSFIDVKEWITQIKENSDNEDIIIILIGNKSDLEKKRKVTPAEGEELSKENNIHFFETSAKKGNNIQEVFTCIAEDIYSMMTSGKMQKKNQGGVKIKNSKKKGKKMCCSEK